MSLEAERARLAAVIGALAGPPPPTLADFVQLFSPRSLEKREAFVSAGTTPTSIAFVCEGLLRMYYPRPDGRESNKSFVAENELCAAFEALLDGRPTRLAIECLEPTRLLVASYAEVRSLYDRDPYWDRVGRCVAERLYVKKVRKEAQLLMGSASERYEVFLTECAGIEARVPDYHVASYLGITPESLSRIRRARARS